MKMTRSAASFLVFFCAFFLLLMVPKQEIWFLLRMLVWREDVLRLLRFLWVANRWRCIVLTYILVLLLVGIVSFVIFVAALRRERREQRSRPGVQARSEQAVGCQHAAGREKYLRQLDEHLKSGLIDKAEYKLLCERYLRMDIDEDVH